MASATEKPQWREGDGPGLECPLCGCPESRVVWVRKRSLKVNGAKVGGTVRARECDHCQHRFTTTERLRDAD